jgi:CHAD domain-containing protein
VLYGDSSGAKDYLACLSALQDALGHDNDVVVTQPLLRAVLLDPVTPEVQRSIGALMGWQARDRIAAHAQLRRQWRRFKALRPFWAD